MRLVRRLNAFRVAAAVLALGAAPALAGADDLIDAYRTLTFREAAPSRPAETPVPGREEGDDFGKVELGAHLGFLAFSSDFEADPELSGGIAARVGLPWFSKKVVGLEDSDAFGLWADLTISAIDRDIGVLNDSSGILLFVTVGADFTAYKDDLFFVRAQLGVQYGYFGGVTDLHNGAAFVIGAVGGFQFTEGFWATFNPQAAFGDSGDIVFFFNFGVEIVF